MQTLSRRPRGLYKCHVCDLRTKRQLFSIPKKEDMALKTVFLTRITGFASTILPNRMFGQWKLAVFVCTKLNWVVAKNLTKFDDGQTHVKVDKVKEEEEEAVNETSSFSAQTMFAEQNLLQKSEIKEVIPDTEDVLDQSFDFECSPTKLEEP